MFATRLLTVAIALPLFVVALLFLSQPLWAVVLLPLLAIASWEWMSLARCPVAARLIYVAAIVLSALALFHFSPGSGRVRIDIAAYVVSCVFWVAVAPVWLALGWTTRNPIALGIAGWVALVPMWLALVQLKTAPWALLLFLSIVWVADTAAYLAGKQWGRRKLAPRISPGKTWEGALGAAAAVAVYYGIVLVAAPAGAAYFHAGWGLAVFACIFAFSVEGDLFESWMKRTAGVKDSGQFLPGHGGILDRIDGLTASLPAAALAFYLR